MQIEFKQEGRGWNWMAYINIFNSITNLQLPPNIVYILQSGPCSLHLHPNITPQSSLGFLFLTYQII